MTSDAGTSRTTAALTLTLSLLVLAGCRDSPTVPRAVEEPAPIISFGELARRVFADPLLRSIAEHVQRPDVARHLDAALGGMITTNAAVEIENALVVARLTLAHSVADTGSAADSAAMPTEEDILVAVLTLAAEGVSLMNQASASGLPRYLRVR